LPKRGSSNSQLPTYFASPFEKGGLRGILSQVEKKAKKGDRSIIQVH